MNFLKKLGSVLAKGLAVATGLEPLILPMMGSNSKAGVYSGIVINDLTSIAQVVVQTEAILSTGSGPDKLRAASPLVANIIRTSELVSGHGVQDEAKFIAACQGITSNVADLLSSLKADKVQQASGPAFVLPPASVPTPSTPQK